MAMDLRPRNGNGNGNGNGKTMGDLQSRLDEFKKAFESGAPPYNATQEAIETILCGDGFAHSGSTLRDIPQDYCRNLVITI